MKGKPVGANVQSLLAMLCSLLLVPGDTLAFTPHPQETSPPAAVKPAAAKPSESTKIPAEQLDSLVSPVALYPDPLLAQVLAASTYPLEIILLQRWLEKNKNLKEKELVAAVAKQPWEPSVQALAALPELVRRLSDDIQWTADLGNAFLAQQSDVMDAVQRMRKKAKDKGSLQTNEQQVVETRVVESKSVIVIEQANPQVVYVPSYDPVVVYGPAVYPYPAAYYPSWGYYAAGAAISFGFGMMMGAFWSGGWGWGCGWGGNNVYINHNNNFNRNTNINRGANVGNINRGNNGLGNRPSQQPSGGRSNWSHNPQHRGGTPYRDRGTADRFGGSARGDSLTQRRAQAEQRVGGGTGVSNRMNNSALADRRGSSGSGLADRGSSGLGSRTSGGGADRIGSRDLSRGGGGDRSAFGGGSRSFDGSSARNSSSRGFSSVSRGGGSGGGGFRGGGRRR